MSDTLKCELLCVLARDPAVASPPGLDGSRENWRAARGLRNSQLLKGKRTDAFKSATLVTLMAWCRTCTTLLFKKRKKMLKLQVLLFDLFCFSFKFMEIFRILNKRSETVQILIKLFLPTPCHGCWVKYATTKYNLWTNSKAKPRKTKNSSHH